MRQLPNLVQANTTWFINMNSNMKELCGSFGYINSLTLLDVSSNKIHSLCSDFVSNLNNIKHDRLLINMQNNNLQSLPKEIQSMHSRTRFLISKNAFQCGCDMLWMVTWLNNATTPSGGHIVNDYKDVLCYSSNMVTTHISTLQASHLGCYDKILTTPAIIGITCAGFIIIIIISGVIIGVKRWREIRWVVYKNIGVYITRKQTSEDLEGIGFDAFISYR